MRLVRNAQGETTLEVVRTASKAQIKLSPEGHKTVKKNTAIPTLPWSVISPYIKNEMIMSLESYERHPYVLGNHEGTVRYVADNIVLGKPVRRRVKDLQIIRKQEELFDMQGNSLGLQVRHLGKAKVIKSELKKQNLLKIYDASLEVQRGDRIIPDEKLELNDFLLTAAQQQTGFIVGDLEQHTLLGKHNVVVLDIGSENIEAGTVMGIYNQGPNIIDGYQPKYVGESNMIRSAFNRGDEIQQPAMKIGELVIFKTFDKASYALITDSTTVIKRGMIVAKP